MIENPVLSGAWTKCVFEGLVRVWSVLVKLLSPALGGRQLPRERERLPWPGAGLRAGQGCWPGPKAPPALWLLHWNGTYTPCSAHRRAQTRPLPPSSPDRNCHAEGQAVFLVGCSRLGDCVVPEGHQSLHARAAALGIVSRVGQATIGTALLHRGEVPGSVSSKRRHSA